MLEQSMHASLDCGVSLRQVNIDAQEEVPHCHGIWGLLASAVAFWHCRYVCQVIVIASDAFNARPHLLAF